MNKKTPLSFRRVIKHNVRRIMLIFVNLVFNNDIVLGLIGLINKRVNLIKSVFLAYPANENYALAYVYRYRLPKVKWQPFPVGFLVQNNKIIIMFCISANNGEFSDPQNHEKVVNLERRMERIRILLKAECKTFAGIIPGVLYHKRIIRDAPEADLTAEIIKQAIGNIRQVEKMSDDTPILIIGSRGFIGRRVINLLSKDNTYGLDIGDSWPDYLVGQRVILVNITIKNVLMDYIEKIWPGVVIINEVYPEPPPETLSAIKDHGCTCYHIKGVKANAFPPFPGAYGGAIPCCAAWLSDG